MQRKRGENSNSPENLLIDSQLHDITIKTDGKGAGGHFKHPSVSNSSVRMMGDFKFGERNASHMNVYDGPNQDIVSHQNTKNSRSHSSMMKIRNNPKQTNLISKRSSAATAMHSAANMPALI